MAESLVDTQAVESVPPAIAAAVELPHLKRNFILGVANGALFNFAETLMSIDTVLPWFVQQLGGSNFLIGLVGPMRDAGWYLPQLFASRWLERASHKLPLYRRMALIRFFAWLIWALSTLLIKNDSLLLFMFFTAYGVNAIASGFAGLPFMDIVAKTIPSRRRGAYFGGRLLYGSLLGLGAGALVSLMLGADSPAPFPQNIGWVFVLAWISASIGLFLFAQVIEPPGEVRLEENSLRSHVRRAAYLPRQDHNVRFFILGRVVLFLSYIATPFYAIYSISILHAPAEIIGVYVAARTLAALAINPIWSRLSDRRGNRLVMRVATLCGLIVPAWALLAPIIADMIHIDPGLLFVPIFMLLGIYDTGVGIGGNNLLLEIAPGDDRAIYIGLTNTIFGIAYFSTIISGLVVDWLGYHGVFILALIFFVIAFWAISQVQEPRELEARLLNET